jgi:hypothetical protein
MASADQTICYNTIPAALNATSPTGGSGSNSYQWQVSIDNILFSDIPGATSLSYSPGILGQTTYYRQRQLEISGCGSVMTNVVTITVLPMLTAGIATTDQTICYNSVPVSINATLPTGGDGTFTYQWQISLDNFTFSNIAGATGISYSPGALTQTTYYHQIQTSGSGCGSVITNDVKIIVYPVLTAGLASADQSVCYNSIPTTINAIDATGGDGTYTYQWQVSTDNIVFSNIPGATSLSYSPGLLTQTTYYRQVQTSGSGCGIVNSNVVTITVYPDFIPGVASFDQTICYNSSPSAINASIPSGGDGNYLYQWQVSTDNILFINIPGATSLSYSPG